MALFAASIALLGLAPLVMPTSYSWIEHTTSESAAQGVSGAWMARAGFGAYGAAVAVLVWRRRDRWNLATLVSHGLFAGSMLLVAAFSSRSWEEAAPFDRWEDRIHSAGATTMGFAFVVGVISRAVGTRRASVLDASAVVAATVLPLGMLAFSQVRGVLQRLMFAIAFLWYLHAARSSDEFS